MVRIEKKKIALSILAWFLPAAYRNIHVYAFESTRQEKKMLTWQGLVDDHYHYETKCIGVLVSGSTALSSTL